jgi:hypothetical protein
VIQPRPGLILDEQLMSIKDVADFLKLNQTTLYAWAAYVVEKLGIDK